MGGELFDLYKWGARGNRPESLPVCPRIGSFNPRLCTGGDPVDSLMAMGYPYFNPRPPHRERPSTGAAPGINSRYFNPRPRTGGDDAIIDNKVAEMVSTHAPRTGGDTGREGKKMFASKISTHAPRTGGDAWGGPPFRDWSYFNPRPPHRGRRMGGTSF